MTIKETQVQVDNWIKEYGDRYFNELTNMAILTEEVGEMARIISRRYGEQSEKESDKNKDLGDEMADVLFVLVCLANQTGVDLEEAMRKNFEKKTTRDKEIASFEKKMDGDFKKEIGAMKKKSDKYKQEQFERYKGELEHEYHRQLILNYSHKEGLYLYDMHSDLVFRRAIYLISGEKEYDEILGN